MRTICPHCNQEYDVTDEYLNQTVTCTVCNKNFIVEKALSPLEKAEMFTMQAARERKKRKIVIALCGTGISVLVSGGVLFCIFGKPSNPERLYRQGYAYLLGIERKQNKAKGIEYLSDAALKGHAEAQCKLAICYFSGNGVSQNNTKAVDLLEKAITQGNPEATLLLGKYLLAENKNNEKAIRGFTLLKKLADNGNSDAAFEVGKAFKTGNGTPWNLVEAVNYFQKSKNKDAEIALAACYLHGKGVSPDIRKAFQLYQKSPESPWALQGVAECYKKLYEPDLSKEFAAKALLRFQKKATDGDGEAMYETAIAFLEGRGTSQDKEKAKMWLQKGADAKNPRCMMRLAVMSLEQKKEIEKSIETLLKIGEAAHAEAFFALGNVYRKGEVVPAAENKAKEYFEKSAAMGYWSGIDAYAKTLALKEACLLYEKHAALGVSEAQEKMGDIFKNGLLAQKVNLPLAVKWYWQCRALDKLDDMLKFSSVSKQIAELYCAEAKAGNPDCMERAGFLYLEGKGVEKNTEKAAEFFIQGKNWDILVLKMLDRQLEVPKIITAMKKASDGGDIEATFMLGAVYYEGIGIKTSVSKALSYYLNAAEKGHAKALFCLSEHYYNDMYTPKKEAVKWIQRAAEKNYPAALTMLAKCYLKGEVGDFGVNANEATKLFEKAAKLDEHEATFMLALLALDSGDKSEKNAKKALALIQKAARHKVPEAEFAMSEIMNAKVDSLETPQEKAYFQKQFSHFFEKSVRQGYVPALLLSTLLGIPDISPEKADTLIKRISDYKTDLITADICLGALYFKKKDYRTAYDHLKKARKAGFPYFGNNLALAAILSRQESQGFQVLQSEDKDSYGGEIPFNLALCYILEVGTRENYAAAIPLLKTAGKNFNKEAAKILPMVENYAKLYAEEQKKPKPRPEVRRNLVGPRLRMVLNEKERNSPRPPPSNQEQMARIKGWMKKNLMFQATLFYCTTSSIPATLKYSWYKSVDVQPLYVYVTKETK